jgi:zinc transporter, ZIP family
MRGNVWFALLLTLLAGLSTGIGGTIAYFMRRPKPWQMALVLGFSAGVMVYISFAELLNTAINKIGFLSANIGFFAGIIFITLLDVLIPHEYEMEHKDGSAGGNTALEVKLRRAGILVALGIAIHNLPEGLATFSSAYTGNTALGILVAVAIALHNIPEGISVSIPIAEATGNRKKAFLYSLASGLAEPLGAVIGYVLLAPFLSGNLVYSLLAFAAGIMVYISLDELLPTAHMYGKEHFVIGGIIGGMGVMALSILWLPK